MVRRKRGTEIKGPTSADGRPETSDLAGKAWEAERNRLDRMLDILPAYMILLSSDHRIVFANRFFRERFGDPRGRSFEEVLGYREPSECQTFKVLDDGKAHQWEGAGTDGRTYYLYDFPFPEEGTMNILEVGLDITEQKIAQAELRKARSELETRVQERTRELEDANKLLKNENSEHLRYVSALKESERKYRQLVDNMQEGLWLLDAKGYTTFVNVRMAQMLGYTEDYMLGRHVLSFMDEDGKKLARHRLQQRDAGMKGQLDFEFIHKDGQRIYVLAEVTSLKDQDGSYLGALCCVADITNRRHGEDVLKQRSDQLKAAYDELEAFSYSVSHDLRAPLRSMQGFSQILLEDYADHLDDEGRAHLRRIQQSGRTMALLIDDLLKLSRITRSEMSTEILDLTAIAGEIINELGKVEPSRRVEIILEPGIFCRGDSHLIRIAVENLLQNAWKFTGKTREAKIEIGTTESNNRKTYFVRDNGAGFDMAYAGKLFSPFYRMHRTDEFPGTGIGLAIVRRIVQRHGGEVWAESSVGKGATFYFTLG